MRKLLPTAATTPPACTCALYAPPKVGCQQPSPGPSQHRLPTDSCAMWLGVVQVVQTQRGSGSFHVAESLVDTNSSGAQSFLLLVSVEAIQLYTLSSGALTNNVCLPVVFLYLQEPSFCTFYTSTLCTRCMHGKHSYTQTFVNADTCKRTQNKLARLRTQMHVASRAPTCHHPSPPVAEVQLQRPIIPRG